MTSGGLVLLQMVLEPDIERCAVGPSREVDYEIPHQLKRRTKHCK